MVVWSQEEEGEEIVSGDENEDMEDDDADEVRVA